MFYYNVPNPSYGVSLGHFDKFISKIVSRNGTIGFFIIMGFLTYGFVSTAWTGLEAAGVQGNLWILTALIAIGIFSSLIIYLILLLWVAHGRLVIFQTQINTFKSINQTMQSVPIVSRNDESKLKEFLSKANLITVLSSMSSTYYTQFNRVLRQIERTTPLRITVLVRRDRTHERDILLLNSLRQWNSLSDEMPFKLSVNLLACNDWVFMLRGLIFDEKEGLFGVYLREGELTRGSEDDYLYVRNDGTDAQKYLFSIMLSAAKIMIANCKQLNNELLDKP